MPTSHAPSNTASNVQSHAPSNTIPNVELRAPSVRPVTASRISPKWPVLLADLANIAAQYSDAALASSLSAEDMVLTHAIYETQLAIDIFTLDTGMLPAQTLTLLEGIGPRYGQTPTVYHPDPQAVEEYVQEHGRYAFYDSVPLRKACCQLRKVEPLRRALSGRTAWLTGQRRDQAVTRGELPKQEFDSTWNLEKFNPLAEWSEDDVWQTIRALNIAYNPLHDQGYPSIGCDPCTRAIRPGEDVRAGRWWWESSSSKECGLHEINVKHVSTATSAPTAEDHATTEPRASAALSAEPTPSDHSSIPATRTRDA